MSSLKNKKIQSAAQLLLAALLLFQLAACAARRGAPAAGSEEYATFRDVPGVTADEIAAIEEISAQSAVLLYGMTSSTECFFDNASNSNKGYAVLFCKWLTDFFGVRFRPNIYEWDVLMRGLDSGEIQFSGDISSRMTAADGFYSTDAIAERRIVFVSSDGMTMTRRRVENDNRQMRYGFLKGASAYEIVAPYLGEDAEFVEISDYVDMRQKLMLGQIDALAMDETVDVIFPPDDNFVTETFEPIAFNSVSMATADERYAPFISVLQKYLDAAGTYKLRDMYEDGRTVYLQYRLHQRLGDAHFSYIDAHATAETAVRIAIDRDDYPVSFWNENAKEYQGIAVDLIRETERITGMRFVFVEEDNGDDEEILLSGVADALGGVIRNESLEGRLTFAEKPYKTDYYAFVSLSGFRDITLSDVPYLNVGLLSGAAYEETFYSMFPNHKNVAVFADRHAAETALERGGIDVLLGTRDILLDITNYHEQTGYRENLVLTRPYEVYFAFAPGDDGATLSWIMSRALDHIDAEMTVDGWTRRVFDYSGALAKAQRPFLFAVVALMTVLLIAGIVLIIRARASAARLDRLVSIRTTELRNRTQELEIQTEAADAASVAKSDFLARMSHEIRTPLNAVIGMTEVAHRAETIEKKNSSLLEIEAASHHLLGILNDVLDMAKIESGKFQLSDADFLLRTALVEVQHIIEQRCAEKRITLAVNFADLTDYGVAGDKLRLKQVLINLLGNAVKFTPEDGGIRFFADVSEAEESVRVRFSVTDTGIGISEEQIGKLFNAFEQANETISVRFGGTGLGLSISQNLVRQMGGLIEVTSTLGEGSTFAFELEMPRALHLEQQGEAAPESAHDFTGKRILLAEDIEINRLILRELLSDTHVGIDEAEDGAQALEMFRAAPAGYYQTILMDVQMPNMNGHEATRAIRALAPERPDAAAVPIIALTANAYKEDIDRALASGMNGHLAKPIDIKEVVAMLERQLLPGN